MFRIHDDVGDARVDAAIDMLQGFAAFPGVVSWITTRSLDERKGRVVIEEATFESRGAFERFRGDPAHVRAAKTMAEIADWWIGDYEA
nr:Dabb family protein [Microbacterium sp. ZXX196]